MFSIVAVAAVGLVACGGGNAVEQFLDDHGATTEEFCTAWHEAEVKYGSYEGAVIATATDWLLDPTLADLPIGPGDLGVYAREEC